MRADGGAAKAYRRVALDAAVQGGDERGLARLCFEALDAALGAALRHGERGNMIGARASLARAADALAALRTSLSGEHPLAESFHSLIGAAHRGLARCMAAFDAVILRAIRRDFASIGEAMEASAVRAGA